MATEAPETEVPPKWFRWPVFWWAAAIILATCAAQSWIYFNHRQMVGAEGDPGRYFGVGMLVLLAGFAMVFVGLPAGVLLSFSRRTRLIGLALLVGFAANVAAIHQFGKAGTAYRMNVFRALGERSMPLIDAIKAYEAQHGNPPDTLESLVPEFIEAIPTTGMAAYPEFELLSGEDAYMWMDNSWIVRIKTSSGPVNFDQFMYFPNQDYPEELASNRFERLGAWAYYHE